MAKVDDGGWGARDVVVDRAPNKHREGRKDVWEERQHLTDYEFKRRYKVSKRTFTVMVEKLRPYLEPVAKPVPNVSARASKQIRSTRLRLSPPSLRKPMRQFGDYARGDERSGQVTEDMG